MRGSVALELMCQQAARELECRDETIAQEAKNANGNERAADCSSSNHEQSRRRAQHSELLCRLGLGSSDSDSDADAERNAREHESGREANECTAEA